MTVHHDIQHLPEFENALVTIGTFDGIHRGHQQILQLMKEEAERVGGETVIITFHPHPRTVIDKQTGAEINGADSPASAGISLLNTLEERISILSNSGIDHLVIVPFTKEFAEQSATAYISDFLVNTFHPHTIIIGHDHRFGKNRSGDFQLLEDKAAEFGYEVKEIPGFMLKDLTISSTRIREAMLTGDVETASFFLGYDYFFSGTVVEGNKLGRTFGYPTANLQIEDENKLIPGNGVYAVEVLQPHAELGHQEVAIDIFRGMMNIGVRPTVDGSKRVIEVHIFNFDKDIYGETLTVTIKKHLRSEIKFDGLDSLKKQLGKDKKAAIEVLGKKKPV
ncbi:MAG: bifunctional riboflavin kinase/FAD synthetase [Bacteroidota bacterium]|nr:bifunctional riboflavin kinase/FAD synthetase [Ferruginibacter sp.]